jgi:hypothetical protein
MVLYKGILFTSIQSYIPVRSMGAFIQTRGWGELSNDNPYHIQYIWIPNTCSGKNHSEPRKDFSHNIWLEQESG